LSAPLDETIRSLTPAVVAQVSKHQPQSHIDLIAFVGEQWNARITPYGYESRIYARL